MLARVGAATSSKPDRSPGTGGATRDDPWQALSLLITGVIFYGGLGWLLDTWLTTSWLAGLGVTVGGGLGLYLVVRRYALPREHDRPTRTHTTGQEPPC